ncbi:MAG: hypothetical protein ACXWT1_09725 [Methylobacter sp.]
MAAALERKPQKGVRTAFFQAIKSPHEAGVLSAVIIVIELWFVQLDPSSVTYFIIIIS